MASQTKDARNTQRKEAILDGIEKFKEGDASTKIEMATTLGAGIILGGATGSAGVAITKVAAKKTASTVRKTLKKPSLAPKLATETLKLETKVSKLDNIPNVQPKLKVPKVKNSRLKNMNIISKSLVPTTVTAKVVKKAAPSAAVVKPISKPVNMPGPKGLLNPKPNEILHKYSNKIKAPSNTLAQATAKASVAIETVRKAPAVDLKMVPKAPLPVAGVVHKATARANTVGDAVKNLLFTKAGKLDFAPTGFKDAQLYPITKLPTLVEYLRRRGVDLYPVEFLPRGQQFPGFTSHYNKTGRPALFLPRDATILEVKHELSHYLDFKKMGKVSYDKLSTYQKEKMVLDRLKENRVWKTLTEGEQGFSELYVENKRVEQMLKVRFKC